MSLVLVVDNIFQGDAEFVVQIVEELLVEDESNAGDFLHMALE